MSKNKRRMLIDSYHDDNIATGEQEDYDSETICDDQNEENEEEEEEEELEEEYQEEEEEDCIE